MWGCTNISITLREGRDRDPGDAPPMGGRVVAGSQKPRQLVRQGVASWLHEGRQNSGTCHGAGHQQCLWSSCHCLKSQSQELWNKTTWASKSLQLHPSFRFQDFPRCFFGSFYEAQKDQESLIAGGTWRRSLSPMVWWSAAGAGCCDVEMVGRSLKWFDLIETGLWPVIL